MSGTAVPGKNFVGTFHVSKSLNQIPGRGFFNRINNLTNTRIVIVETGNYVQRTIVKRMKIVGFRQAISINSDVEHILDKGSKSFYLDRIQVIQIIPTTNKYFRELSITTQARVDTCITLIQRCCGALFQVPIVLPYLQCQINQGGDCSHRGYQLSDTT